MTAIINELISAPAGFEYARDLIAAMLAVELANQKVLAAATDGADESDYDFEVYVDRAISIDRFQNEVEKPPCVNVWWQSLNEHEGTSTVLHNQDTATFFLDFTAGAIDKGLVGGEYIRGDVRCRTNLTRMIRVVRGIIMSGHYTYLGDVRGANQRILTRSIRSIVVDDPQRIEGERVAHWVATARMTLDVGVQMTSPQVVGETSELLSVTALRPSDNKVMMRADYE